MSELKHIPIPDEIHSTLYKELISIHSLSPFMRNNSFARLNMFTGHIGQALPIKHASPRKIQTGSEQDYGKYTMNITMPCNGIVLKVIKRYRQSIQYGIQADNPETVVIYEDIETKQIGHISLVNYSSHHQQFGFRYKTNEGAEELICVGKAIPKNTVFRSSPNVTDEGDWCFGTEANVALCTFPAGAEDGIRVSDKFLEKCTFITLEKRTFQYGNRGFPVNIYGTKEVYKPFPEIGDTIRDDGLVAAIRPYDARMVLSEQNMKAACTIDANFDEKHYARPNGKVIDVRVITQNVDDSITNTFAKKYSSHTINFHREILEFYEKQEQRLKSSGQKPNLTHEFHNLVVNSMRILASERKETELTYRQNKLDHVFVEITIEYENVPTLGNKLTDTNGGKGVVVSVVPAENMPIDKYGVRADIIMEPSISRMNIGRYVEQYINSISNNVHNQICQMLNVPKFASRHSTMDTIAQGNYQAAFTHLVDYYYIINPLTKELFSKQDIDQVAYLAYIVEGGIGIWYPTDNPRPTLKMYEMLSNSVYDAPPGPITYIGNGGVKRTTELNIRIGSLYVMLLEKIADDKSAVSSSKTQVHGAAAPITKLDKHQYPSREQASKLTAESENRPLAANIGGYALADILDRDNSPNTHKIVCEGILTAEYPSNIKNLVDRNVVPFGGHKPLGLSRHYLYCSGIELYHIPEKN